MYSDLSKKQIEILEYIKNQIRNIGYPPSVREICKGVNLKSTSTVHGHLNVIEEKGYIRKDPTKPRAIEVLDPSGNFPITAKETMDIPVIGDVAAGAPMLAFEEIVDTYPVPLELVKDRDMFFLRVKGDSMIDAGIFNGDLVLVEKTSSAENGEIIVALIENEATIKRFYKEKNYVRLQPENKLLDPIYTRDLTILGKVKALIREL